MTDGRADGGHGTAGGSAREESGDGLLDHYATVIGDEGTVVLLTLLTVLLFPYLFAGAPVISDLLSGYYGLTTLILIWGIFTMGYDLLHGYTGLLSFGHAAFWGTGSIVAGLLVEYAGIGYPLVLVAAGLLASIAVAWILGVLSLRRGGIYFSILTLAFGQMLYFTIFGPLGPITGGEDGLLLEIGGLVGVIPLSAGVPILTPLGLVGSWLYLLVAIFTVISVAVAYRILRSPYGLVFKAIRENEQRAEFVGLNVWRYKLVAFVISGAFAGVAGALFTVYNGSTSAETFYWLVSGEVVIMSILGGVGTLFGAFLGAGVYLYMSNVLSSTVGDSWHLMLGLLFVLVVWLVPRGLWGGVQDLKARLTGEERDRQARADGGES
ncbi:branched-chain amino acid ABC transporter permease [Haloarchaeobius amylolyticus]|uniref:branched-chain amino acid ABC transporter permease n=1 Tax=Haloarchaeobius amylolyticus TaxID=1198296 RepID=UPI00226FE0A7|nr:branched-chain amino acid ABC transporter permease [Haloarchaeobius amylolyticus]